MAATAFDTLAYVEHLEAVGFAREQAKALAEAQLESLDSAGLATKADIDLLRAEFNGKFTLLNWMLGAIIAGMLALLLRAFF